MARFDIAPDRAVVPALPGTNILQLLGEGEERSVSTSPVVCWFVVDDGVVPVTARGMHDGIPDLDYVIEFATGQVIAPDVGSWTSQVEYLKGLTANDADDAARQLPLDLVPIEYCADLNDFARHRSAS